MYILLILKEKIITYLLSMTNKDIFVQPRIPGNLTPYLPQIIKWLVPLWMSVINYLLIVNAVFKMKIWIYWSESIFFNLFFI